MVEVKPVKVDPTKLTQGPGYSGNQGMAFQRAAMTTLLFRILLSGSFQPPAQIRIALNSANDHISWLDDIKLTIIPFIVQNQDAYFV